MNNLSPTDYKALQIFRSYIRTLPQSAFKVTQHRISDLWPELDDQLQLLEEEQPIAFGGMEYKRLMFVRYLHLNDASL